jgi:aminoglycoside phosphotransferase (APT) family kinase protein
MVDHPLSVRAAGDIVGAAVTDVVLRTGGQLSTVYEVRCAGPVDAVIVKIYADEWHWKIAKEVHVYRLLAEAGAGPVPEILRAELDTSIVGRAFTVMTMLPGRPLSEVSAELDAAQNRQIYRQLGGSLSSVHRIEQDSFGYLTTQILDPMPDNTTYMSRQFAKKLREFREHDGDRELHDGMQAHIAETAGLFAHCAGPVLCHNDFHEGNVLVTRAAAGWTITGFIDVENAVAADPLLDLAKTDYYAVRGDADKRAGLLDGYGPLPDEWAERWSVYRLYHALELWDWFASIGNTEPLHSIADDIRGMIRAGERAS